MTIVLVAAQIAAFLLIFLYLIFKSVQKKGSPLLTLVGIVFLVGVTAAGGYFLAKVKTEHRGYREWRLEREYFFGLFTKKLAVSGNLKTAAQYMQTREVKEKTLSRIREIVEPFELQGISLLSAGGLLLFLAAVSLWFRSLRGRKYYPYVFIVFVWVGGILFDVGLYCQQYASGTEETLKSFLHSQQAFLMRDVADIETDLSVPEIIKVTQHEAGKAGRGKGERLLKALVKKKSSRY
ncbi:MAG: hypothetical protein IKZ41_11275 [Clostridia bacterium]|nr:hypothetical protein [Clostridia bacterium]